MKCPNCGAENIDGSSFCIKCGTRLGGVEQSSTPAVPINEQSSVPTQPSQNIQQPVQVAQPTQSTVQPTMQMSAQTVPVTTNTATISLNYLMYMVAILLKPLKCFKEEENKLNDTKTSIILSVIIAAIMTIVNMIKTIITTVRVTDYSWTSGLTTTWKWENLKNIKWVELIGKNFLIYAVIIVALALVFYLGSLIIKKQTNFIKMLSISATSLIPMVVGVMILAPIGSLVWAPLSVIFMVVGSAYTLLIFYELINNELKLDGDIKIYFNLVCFSVLAVVGYFAFIKLFTSSVTGGLDNILDMFK